MLVAADLPRCWQKPLAGLVVTTVACVMTFWKTWSSIVLTWANTETFAHGFIVAPISLWLVWTRRNLYRNLQPAPSPTGLIFLAVCGAIWLISDLVHTLVISQWAVVGVLICSFWTLLGNRTTNAMLFPILFLFLMVPFGEDFVPFLMEYTATFVVTMLRLTGISVYREGLHFTLTTGNWSVIDACSGIRYLIASITLGAVFAYLNYNSYKKRAWLMLASVLVPILANGFRAYLIVMIGHLSNMKLATGVDHLVYGWVFFGLVMLLLFYIGSFWQDPPLEKGPSTMIETGEPALSYPSVAAVSAAIILCFAIWPMASTWMINKQGAHVEIPQQILQPQTHRWQNGQHPIWNWQPEFTGVAASAQNYLFDGESTVGIYAANFGDEARGELINSQNYLVSPKNRIWQVSEMHGLTVHWPDEKSITANETLLSGASMDLLVLHWYRIGSVNTANGYYAKWLQLLKRLSGDTSPELKIVIYTETPHGDYRKAEDILTEIAEACCN